MTKAHRSSLEKDYMTTRSSVSPCSLRMAKPKAPRMPRNNPENQLIRNINSLRREAGPVVDLGGGNGLLVGNRGLIGRDILGINLKK